jgi:hypothetical protein
VTDTQETLPMPGLATAVTSGRVLEVQVAALAAGLGLEVRTQYKIGRRIWGAVRKIDLILTHPGDRQRLGVECKYQGTQGSAEEKIPLILQDIGAWPIPGIVVFAGDGFSPHMQGYLLSSGKAVELEDLEPWLRLYFGLELRG